MKKDISGDGLGKSFRELIDQYNRELLQYSSKHATSAAAEAGKTGVYSSKPVVKNSTFSADEAKMGNQYENRVFMEQAQQEEQTSECIQTANYVGYMQVRVFTGRQAIPIQGAQVVISQSVDSREILHKLLYTDRDGNTPIVELSAISSSPPHFSGSEQPYAVYNIRVDCSGYFSVRNFNAAVYTGMNAIQPVEMIPLSKNDRGDRTGDFEESTAGAFKG